LLPRNVATTSIDEVVGNKKNSKAIKITFTRMNKFTNWLQQPYPINFNWSSLLKGGILGGVFVTFFLFTFKPFSSYEGLSQGQILWISVQFGLITVVWTLVWGLFIKVLPNIFKEEGWNVWREIVFHIFFIMGIGSFNMIYAANAYNYGLSWPVFWQWQWITLSIGIFPTVMSVMYKQIKWMKEYSVAAANLSVQVSSKENHTINDHKEVENQATNPIKITLSGDNLNETLSIFPEQLVYISAADNYVHVFYTENEQIKNKLLRATLRKMEDALANIPQCYRCHRTFLVNLQKVQHISGNAQGYKLHLHDIELTIPVSRSLNEEIQRKILTD
jgi:DNA-binding LytR/AlgR family response regulator